MSDSLDQSTIPATGTTRFAIPAPPAGRPLGLPAAADTPETPVPGLLVSDPEDVTTPEVATTSSAAPAPQPPEPDTPSFDSAKSHEPKARSSFAHIWWLRARGPAVALLSRVRRVLRRDDGMSTAEYAVGTVAAVAFSATLYKVVTSETVLNALNGIITKALNATF